MRGFYRPGLVLAGFALDGDVMREQAIIRYTHRNGKSGMERLPRADVPDRIKYFYKRRSTATAYHADDPDGDPIGAVWKDDHSGWMCFYE